MVIDGTINPDSLVGTAADDTIHGLQGSDELYGLAGNDLLFGDTDDDDLYGGDDHDILLGGRGDDWLFGEHGDDSLAGGAGDDEAWGGVGNDTVSGGAGDDVFYGSAGADTLYGDQGEDTVDYSASAIGVTANLALGIGGRGDALGDVYHTVENIIGTQFADTLYGNAVDNWLRGGDGDDVMRGGAGSDRFEGGSGTDTVDYSNAFGVEIDMSGTGAGGIDSEDTFDSIEVIVTGGTNHDNIIYGNDSSNTLIGGNTFDEFHGMDGNDTLDGGLGINELTGGLGADVLIGRGGPSINNSWTTYIFNSVEDSPRAAFDTIQGFSARDFIDLRNIDANQNIAGDQAFRLLTSRDFTGAGGELIQNIKNGATRIFGDTDGDQMPDFAIRIVGEFQLNNIGFIF